MHVCRWYGSSMDYDQNAARQVLVDWIMASEGVASAFDFVTKGILQEAAKYGPASCGLFLLRQTLVS